MVTDGYTEVSDANKVREGDKCRNIGERAARKMERHARLPANYFDGPDAVVIASNQIQEPAATYNTFGELSEAEQRLLAMWRTWSDDVKQYAFGQMLVVSYTQDVLAQMFVVDGKKKVTADEVNRYAVDTVSETGEFRAIEGPKK